MGEAYWAAREGDVLLHTSLLADVVGAAVELGFYAAISFLPGGLLLSFAVGVFMEMTGGNALLSKAADWVSSLFPPNEDGRIISGSSNTRINGKPAARAAGTVDQNIPLPPEQPQTFVDVVSNMFAQLPHLVSDLPNTLIETAEQMISPTVASPDPRAEPRDEDKISCKKHPRPKGNEEYLAEGSKKVYINGQPAVRSNDRRDRKSVV